MRLEEIKKLAAQGEGLHIEFKKKANHPEKIVKELVAFANTSGGTLLLGVDDDGTISGSRQIEGEVFVLEEAIKKLTKPLIPYTKHIVALNQKKGVAIFEVTEGSRKPYAVRAHADDPQKAYVRVADQSLQASREMREILRRRLKPKDIQFNYGEKEKVLLKHLDVHDHITVNQFKALAKLPRFVASKTLIRLTLANVLDVKPEEKEDRFVLKNQSST